MTGERNYSFQDLHGLIGTHLTKYNNLFHTIIKLAGKHGRDDVQVETQKALILNENLIKHGNKFALDEDYIEGLAKFRKDTKDVGVENPLHDFGTMQFELQEIEMCLHSEETYKKYQIVCFSQFIIVIHLKPEEDFGELFNFRKK